jgi:hypothetical protein
MRVNAFDQTFFRQCVCEQYAVPGRLLSGGLSGCPFCFLDGYTIDFNAARRRIAANPTSPRPASIMA